MLSWLERGLLPDEIDECPRRLKSRSRSSSSRRFSPRAPTAAPREAWVDRVYRDRESQETRRILYVAATRAREELHIFARPSCRRDKNGEWTLVEPAPSLLKTAWPALEPEIREQFEQWKESQAQPAPGQEPEAEPATIESLAASADLFVMPAPPPPTQLRRLPPGYRTQPGASSICHPERAERVEGPASWNSGEWVGYEELSVNAASDLYQRHEGGLVSRALGTAVHVLFQQLAHLRATSEWPAARAALQQFEPRIAAQIRASGIEPQRRRASPLKHSVSLSPPPTSPTVDGSSRPTPTTLLKPAGSAFSPARFAPCRSTASFAPDPHRSLKAPQSGGSSTTRPPTPTSPTPQPHCLASARAFAPQLEAYAQVLRKLHGAEAQLRTALYYPRLQLLDWWEP